MIERRTPIRERLLRGLATRRILCALAVALQMVFSQIGRVESAERPNVVLIMADDLGIEGLGCYGGTDYETPHLDALAKGGLRFTHAYSQPLCTPTRLQIMTGRYNHRNWVCFGVLPKSEKTFGHLMSGFGYRTLLAGKWQLTSYDPPDFPGAEKRRGLGTHPKHAGFDEYMLFHAEETEDKGSRYANPTFLRNGKLHENVEGAYGEDLTVEYILDFMKRHRDEPQFVYYPMALPHWPMVPTPISDDWSDPARRLDEDVKYFPDMVKYMDLLVGRLVKGIDTLGLRERTVILFYSDNGTDRRIVSHIEVDGEKVEVPGGKGLETQSGVRVPLIVNWPDHIAPGVCGDLVDSTDFLPTLAELAGESVPKAYGIDGRSFAPQLLGEKSDPREAVFVWYDPRPGWDKQKFGRSVFALDKRYKLFDDGRLFDVQGDALREVPVTGALSEEADAARKNLRGVIDAMMRPPLSSAVDNEVDAYGRPVDE